MPTKDKWILEKTKYKDISGGFDYTVLHRAGDTEYLSGTLRSALVEWDAFKDVESMTYFMALLLSSRVFVEVNLLSAELLPELEQSKILQFGPGMLDNQAAPYTDFSDAMVIPEVRDARKDIGHCLPVFTAVRELRKILESDKRWYVDTYGDQLVEFWRKFNPDVQEVPIDCNHRIFMYIDFEKLVCWLRQHASEIQSVAFDCMADAPLVMPLNNLLEIVDKLQEFIKNYEGPNAISELRQISLAKHIPKSRRKN